MASNYPLVILISVVVVVMASSTGTHDRSFNHYFESSPGYDGYSMNDAANKIDQKDDGYGNSHDNIYDHLITSFSNKKVLHAKRKILKDLENIVQDADIYLVRDLAVNFMTLAGILTALALYGYLLISIASATQPPANLGTGATTTITAGRKRRNLDDQYKEMYVDDMMETLFSAVEWYTGSNDTE